MRRRRGPQGDDRRAPPDPLTDPTDTTDGHTTHDNAPVQSADSDALEDHEEALEGSKALVQAVIEANGAPPGPLTDPSEPSPSALSDAPHARGVWSRQGWSCW